MAAAAFKQFLLEFPDSELVDNAQYWLAESYYALEPVRAGAYETFRW